MGDNIKLQMRYPDITFFTTGIDTSNINASIELVAKCVSQIINDEEVFDSADLSSEEISEWLQDLSQENFKKIMKFFVNGRQFSVVFKIKMNDDIEYKLGVGMGEYRGLTLIDFKTY